MKPQPSHLPFCALPIRLYLHEHLQVYCYKLEAFRNPAAARRPTALETCNKEGQNFRRFGTSLS